MLKFILLLCVLILPASVSGMDRQHSLSLVESGDNDRCIGTHREISRYQLLQTEWHRFAQPGESWLKASDAWQVTQRRSQFYRDLFVARYHREPTDFEFYVLHNAPAYLVYRPIGTRISETVMHRASRFVNLLHSDDNHVQTDVVKLNPVRVGLQHSVWFPTVFSPPYGPATGGR